MKKSLLIIALILSAPLVADAARQSVTQISGTQSSIGALKTQVNTRLDATDDNFGELYDQKADKVTVIRYWTDWPTTGPNNVLAINTIVAFDGKLYKATQQVTKTGGTPDPATLTTHFTEVGAGDNLGSATASDVAALFSGTGDCLRSDGTKGSCGTGTGTGDIEGVTAGSGISGGGTSGTVTISINPTYTQRRVSSSCSAGSSIRAIAEDGTVTCETDDVGSGSVPSGTVNGQVLIWQTDAWVASTFPGIASYPGAGVPNSTGSAWGTSYTVGTSANNLVQLNGSSQLPAVSGANLTNVAAATATALASNPTDCSANQYATTIAANGNLTCSQVAYSQLSGTPTLGTAAQYNVGTGANNIPQLNASGELPYTIPQLTSLQTASGLTSGDTHLGTFTGTTIADSSTIKTAFQALETAVEGKQASNANLTDLADGSLTGTKVGFADTDNVWTATNVQAALEELNDSINAGAPNGTGAKVHWSQLLGVPAGFTHPTSDGTYYASRNGAWSAFTSGNYTLAMTLTGNTAVTLPTSGTLVASGGNIGAGTATTPSANDNDTSIATTAYVQSELTAYASDTVTLTNKTISSFELGSAATDTTITRDSAGVVAVEGVKLTRTIASGTSALGTSAIASGACGTAVTTTATGTNTTDVINWGFNSDPTGVTGYAPSANGMLTIIAYPTANNVNYKVCNNTAASITPGAITLNWQVTR